LRPLSLLLILRPLVADVVADVEAIVHVVDVATDVEAGGC
jgi:hypothetical protein